VTTKLLFVLVMALCSAARAQFGYEHLSGDEADQCISIVKRLLLDDGFRIDTSKDRLRHYPLKAMPASNADFVFTRKPAKDAVQKVFAFKTSIGDPKYATTGRVATAPVYSVDVAVAFVSLRDPYDTKHVTALIQQQQQLVGRLATATKQFDGGYDRRAHGKPTK
jgi:hypothetical protein